MSIPLQQTFPLRLVFISNLKIRSFFFYVKVDFCPNAVSAEHKVFFLLMERNVLLNYWKVKY